MSSTQPEPRGGRAHSDAVLRGVTGLEGRFNGTLIRPGDPDYDGARKVWNGLIDRRPALILRCAGVADVINAVNVARERVLELAVRGTGHNVTGSAVCDGGFVIDLACLKGIRVDPGRRQARAQAGVTWGEFDHETQAFGLATTGGRISTTGIGGLTLGGGYGWTMRKWGLSIDNLESVDIVTADGRLLTASENEHPDLFWGVRGGGGNFGVVTSFQYALHPIETLVTGGAAFYPVERGAEVLRFYRDLMADAPDDLAAQCNFLLAPPAPFVPTELRGAPVVAIAVCHTGSVDGAQRDLACLADLGRPLLKRIRSMPYCVMQRLFDAAGRFGSFVHGRSGHLRELSDQAIDVFVSHGARVTSDLSIVMISSLGGAVGRVGEDETAFSHRGVAFSYSIDAVWADSRESDRAVRWAEEFFSALRPFSEGVYVNELGDEGQERIREAYSSACYARLVELKGEYDPTNFFHRNQNILPNRADASLDGARHARRT